MTHSLRDSAIVSLLSSNAHPTLKLQGQAFPSLGGGFKNANNSVAIFIGKT
jgi:hypothetical protein